MSRRPLKPAEPQPIVSAPPPQQQQKQASDDGASQESAPPEQVEQAMNPPSPTTKKRKANKPVTTAGEGTTAGESAAGTSSGGTAPSTSPTAKRPRTNTPWTPQEEQRLKQMRDAGNSWSEIAKTFPSRTEGSVKKHWYKVLCRPTGSDESKYFLWMYLTASPHRICIMPSLRRMKSAPPFAPSHSSMIEWSLIQFSEQSAALLAAIKEYDANKWKVIGAKLGKPAKVILEISITRSF